MLKKLPVVPSQFCHETPVPNMFYQVLHDLALTSLFQPHLYPLPHSSVTKPVLNSSIVCNHFLISGSLCISSSFPCNCLSLDLCMVDFHLSSRTQYQCHSFADALLGHQCKESTKVGFPHLHSSWLILSEYPIFQYSFMPVFFSIYLPE